MGMILAWSGGLLTGEEAPAICFDHEHEHEHDHEHEHEHDHEHEHEHEYEERDPAGIDV